MNADGKLRLTGNGAACEMLDFLAGGGSVRLVNKFDVWERKPWNEYCYLFVDSQWIRGKWFDRIWDLMFRLQIEGRVVFVEDCYCSGEYRLAP